MLLFQLVLPLAISVIAGILLHRRRTRERWHRNALLVSWLLVATCLAFGYYTENEKLVIVPDLHHQWRDQAVQLCRDHRLRAEVTGGTWGAQANRVQKQSREPGEAVAPGSTIVITVCRGPFSGNPLHGIPSATRRLP